MVSSWYLVLIGISQGTPMDSQTFIKLFPDLKGRCTVSYRGHSLRGHVVSYHGSSTLQLRYFETVIPDSRTNQVSR